MEGEKQTELCARSQAPLSFIRKQPTCPGERKEKKGNVVLLTKGIRQKKLGTSFTKKKCPL